MTTPPEPNIPLLRKAVEFVEASAEQHGETVDEIFYDNSVTGTVWFQGDWAMLANPELAETLPQEAASLEACGTAYCVAGYICSLQPGYAATLTFTDEGPEIKERIDGKGFYHSHVAQAALGLTDNQAQSLFEGGNTAQDVRRIAEQIAGETL